MQEKKLVKFLIKWLLEGGKFWFPPWWIYYAGIYGKILSLNIAEISFRWQFLGFWARKDSTSTQNQKINWWLLPKGLINWEIVEKIDVIQAAGNIGQNSFWTPQSQNCELFWNYRSIKIPVQDVNLMMGCRKRHSIEKELVLETLIVAMLQGVMAETDFHYYQKSKPLASFGKFGLSNISCPRQNWEGRNWKRFQS